MKRNLYIVFLFIFLVPHLHSEPVYYFEIGSFNPLGKKAKGGEDVGSVLNSIRAQFNFPNTFLLTFGFNSYYHDLQEKEKTIVVIENYIRQKNPTIEEKEIHELSRAIYENAKNLELNENIDSLAYLVALIEVESSFQKNAVSYSGAIGYMQMKPATVYWLLQKEIPIQELFNSQFNISLGVKYINYLYQQFKSIEYTSYAYNFGENSLKKGYYDPQYWKKILVAYQNFLEFKKQNRITNKIENLKTIEKFIDIK